MPIQIKRIYDNPHPDDGYRVLVDRLWPRGISKERAALDEWLNEIAPSDQLRRKFHEGKIGWEQFKVQYTDQLRKNPEPLYSHLISDQNNKITLLFASKNRERNHAIILKDFLLNTYRKG